MSDQTAILSFVVKHARRKLSRAHPAPVSVDEICAHFPKTPRRRLLTLCGKLLHRKLIVSSKPVGSYFYTEEGIALVARGGTIKSGPCAGFTGVREMPADALRARLWKALRIKRRATIPDLLEAARRDGDGDDVSRNAQTYLKALTRAGVVVRMRHRAAVPGTSSPGFIRYQLMLDLGPKAPVVCSTGVYDHNARERIAYRGKENAQ